MCVCQKICLVVSKNYRHEIDITLFNITLLLIFKMYRTNFKINNKSYWMEQNGVIY